MRKITRIIAVLLLTTTHFTEANAQLSNPREKFSITAKITGSPNTSYSWKQPSGETVADGKMKSDLNASIHASIKLVTTKKLTLSLNPFYNVSTRDLDTEWGNSPLAFTLPDVHHHYGANLMLTYQLQALGKPLTLLGTGTGNFSQYGFESAQGMLGGLFTITRNRNTYLSVGAIYLLGSAIVWPLYPMIVYNHRIDNQWSLNIMGVNNHLYYQKSSKLKYSLGMELETSRIFFRPSVNGLPEKSQISLLAEHFGVFADWQASKSVVLTAGTGITVPFFVRLQESGYNKSYLNLTSRVKPFLSLKAKYALFR